MSATIAFSRGWLPQTADKMVIGRSELQLEPIADQGQAEGLIVESPLERVAVFTHHHPELTVSEISRMRRMLIRSRARRAVLFIRRNLAVDSSVCLLASLSKIEIIRIDVEDADLCPGF